nr:transcription factor MYB44-like [Ipomoea batatas]
MATMIVAEERKMLDRIRGAVGAPKRNELLTRLVEKHGGRGMVSDCKIDSRESVAAGAARAFTAEEDETIHTGRTRSLGTSGPQSRGCLYGRTDTRFKEPTANSTLKRKCGPVGGNSGFSPAEEEIASVGPGFSGCCFATGGVFPDAGGLRSKRISDPPTSLTLSLPGSEALKLQLANSTPPILFNPHAPPPPPPPPPISFSSGLAQSPHNRRPRPRPPGGHNLKASSFYHRRRRKRREKPLFSRSSCGTADRIRERGPDLHLSAFEKNGLCNATEAIQ